VITTRAANTRIADFITWVNAYAREHGLDSETIPDDPVTLSRFRRTIAWHIARLPGGTVALAIQYGHLRTLTSEGYSGRSRHGLRDLLDLETACAMASYLQDVNESLDSGGGVSGPAARRLADAARHAATRYERLFLSPRQARALLAEPTLQVHDSPGAFLACNYDPAKALCHPSREVGSTPGHPALDRCDPACANIPRTDDHITALTAEIARLRTESASPLLPGPISQRPAGRAAVLDRPRSRTGEDHRTARPHPHNPGRPRCPPMSATRSKPPGDRLLNGTPLRSDGKLTIVSLAAEAGVKRHVLTHKHTDLKGLFNARVKAQHSVPASETALRGQNAELRRKLDDMRAERDEYKQAADALARALNVLTIENDELRRQASRTSRLMEPRPLTPLHRVPVG